LNAGCPSCGFLNTEDAAFCGRCGSALGVACPACGAGPYPAEISYCRACGTELKHQGIPLERKIVSVLFVDLVGFTGLAEKLDPEDIRRLLDPYYARVRDELERYGGTVEKFIGDAVMALFGAPTAHEDDPERAVRAANAVRDAVARLRTEGTPELHARVGVATGEAVVTLDTIRARGEAMAHGDVVNTAARLEAGAPVDGILVDERTYRATRFQVDFRPAPPLHAKGKADAIPTWEVVAPRGHTGTDRLRHARELVGRTREVDVLVSALSEVVAERKPRLVTLVGPPGIGKSRLVWELYERIEQGVGLVFWRQGRSLPYGGGATFWALGEIVKAHAGILATDSVGIVEDKLHIAVEAAVPKGGEAQWIAKHLAPLAGLALPPELRGDLRTEAFAAWRQFFEAIAARRPLVLVLEDLHWSDDGLLDFVSEHLGDRFHGALLVVATCRPELLERRPGWGAGRIAKTLAIDPLSDEETSRLVGDMLDASALPDELRSALLTRAGGNPLYAEEYVRMLLDRDLLRMGETSWELTPMDLPLPESVQAIVAARLDALPPGQKSLIQDAAVVGKGFWLGALASLGERPRWSVENDLSELERKQLVRSEPHSIVGTEPQLSFLHVIVRDVAYGQIPRSLRAEKHRLAAEWMESLSPDRTEDRAEMLAHHYSSALEYARAAGQEIETLLAPTRIALREVGERALALNAFGKAARYFADALELWPSTAPDRAELVLQLGTAHFHAEGAGDELLEEARDVFLADSRLERAAEAILLIGELLWMRADPDAFRLFDEAAALLDDSPPSPAKAYVLSSRARFLTIGDENEEAIKVGLEALDMADDLGLEEVRAHALDSIGRARVRLGDHQGLADLEASIAIAVAVNSLESVRGYANLGNALVDAGELERAFDVYDEGRRAANRFGDADRIRWFDAERMYECYWSGQWDELARLADEVIVGIEVDSVSAIEMDARLLRSRLRLGRDQRSGALTDSARAVELGRRAAYPEMLVPALALHASILEASGRAADAVACEDELLSLWPERCPTSYWLADVAFTLHSLGCSSRLLEPSGRARTTSRWLEAATAVAEGRLDGAAEIYEAIGSRPDAAVARLHSARQRAEAGMRAEAEAELGRALAVFRQLRASYYVQSSEALLHPV
jgi:class 3 adenylate cyclase/tetratricopeptide (TPR) repeat protein